jgi:Mg2+-importing ATPase
MPFSKLTTLSIEKVVAEFNTDVEEGLKNEVAETNLKKYGFNILESHKVRWIEILFRQFKSAFVYLLIAASAVSLVLGERIDGLLILLFILINAVLGFYQEFKSEQTVQLLNDFVQPKIKVIRDGVSTVIFGKDLTVGDLVVLETGDIIPADVRFVYEHNITVDESILTGESLSVTKTSDSLSTEVSDIYVASNIGFMGTTIVGGSARAIVIAVAKQTEMGKISKLTNETSRESGFEKQLNKFSKFILYLILGTLAIVFTAHLFISPGSTTLVELIVFSIALAVGVVPEALPLVTTFALSRGAVNLTKKKVVVKRLSAIEDLGSIEILCSDKTGTLTENKLHVSGVLSENRDEVILYSALASTYVENKKQLANNSFDLAIFDELGEGKKSLLHKYKTEYEIPFDPVRKRNSVLVSKNGTQTLVVRGAAESIIQHCNLTAAKTKEIDSWVAQQGRGGNRVIAVAIKDFKDLSYTVKDEENNLKLIGLISFHDQVKASTKDAVLKAAQLKVKLKILTGDSKEVAGSVAYEVGITNSPDHVITGDELDKLEDIDRIKAVEEHSVFARVSPEQKYRIIELLQQKYQVGYLGEGINDAPALKIANVALAVEGASDIARSAADIILLSQDLQIIIDGIEEGRKTFVNTVKYIKSTLASNFGNFYAMAFASLLIDYLPMLPIQILLVNLLSDFPMISIATDAVDSSELKNPRSYDIKEIILIATILGLVSTLFDFIFFGIFSRMGEGALQTNWFVGSILTELLLIYSIRTKKIFFKATSWPSVYVVILTVVAAIVTVVIPLSSIGSSVFKFTMPTQDQYILVLTIVAAYFVTTELAKLIYYKYLERSSTAK